MKYLLVLALMVSCSIPFPSAQAASHIVYQNTNWAVVKTNREGFPDTCFISSGGSRVGKDGHTFLIFFPTNLILFAGENIPNYFEKAKVVTFQTSEHKGVEIPTNAIFSAIVPIQDILQGKTENITVLIEFDDGSKATHLFPVSGFQHANMRFQECVAGIKDENKNKVQTVEVEE